MRRSYSRSYKNAKMADQEAMCDGATADQEEIWASLGGDAVERLIASQSIALLDARWLVDLAERGGVLQPRQRLPGEAFITVAKLKSAMTVPLCNSLRVLLLSCEHSRLRLTSFCASRSRVPCLAASNVTQAHIYRRLIYI